MIRRLLAGHSHGALVQALPVSICTEMAGENSWATAHAAQGTLLHALC